MKLLTGYIDTHTRLTALPGPLNCSVTTHTVTLFYWSFYRRTCDSQPHVDPFPPPVESGNRTVGDNWRSFLWVRQCSRLQLTSSKVKVKVGFLYSAAYAITGPARFTIAEVALWQLIGKSKWCCNANCGHPIARVNEQLDLRHSASKNITADRSNQPQARPSARKHSPEDSLANIPLQLTTQFIDLGRMKG